MFFCSAYVQCRSLLLFHASIWLSVSGCLCFYLSVWASMWLSMCRSMRPYIRLAGFSLHFICLYPSPSSSFWCCNVIPLCIRPLALCLFLISILSTGCSCASVFYTLHRTTYLVVCLCLRLLVKRHLLTIRNTYPSDEKNYPGKNHLLRFPGDAFGVFS